MKDYYRILNVPKDFTDDILKKKFRKRALKYHPDRNPNNPIAAQKFKLVSEAYEVLSDPYKRGRYDAKYEMTGSQNDLFNFPSMNSLNIFDSMFKDKNISNTKNTSNSSSYFYSSSTISKNGQLHTKQKMKKNVNGKEQHYYKEYTTDKNGNKKLLKEKGNVNAFLPKKNKFKLLDDDKK
jgi:curved DNA-binding protein CbpA